MRRVTFTSERELEGLNWTANVMDFGVGLMIKAATNEIICAYIKLEENAALFKGKTKYDAKRAVKEAEGIQRSIKGIMSDPGFYDDYSDAVIDYSKNDITLLRLALKQEMDKAGIADSLLLSYVECARILTCMCVEQYKVMMERAWLRWGKNYSETFRSFDVSHLFGAWDQVASSVLRGGNVNLNTPDILGLFDNVCSKFANGAYIEDCFKVAAAEHPDFIKNDIMVKDEE